jgi:hypothetical protein
MSSAFAQLIAAVVRGDARAVARLLARRPELAAMQADDGATRHRAAEHFFDEIKHYMYAGDTALHMAAAAFHRPVARLLVQRGASGGARNRRGAEPLHYAADANHWKPAAQRDTIAYLIEAGAEPNALDKSGVSPLHRAVRTRASGAVRALVAGSAEVRMPNANGSTPLHLAVRDTGRGGVGSDRARTEQAKIIAILIDAGARATDRDGSGKSVLEACPNDRLRALLR